MITSKQSILTTIVGFISLISTVVLGEFDQGQNWANSHSAIHSYEKSYDEDYDINSLYETSLQSGSLEKTLENLPEVLKKNFVLVYNSPSLQGSDFQNPRVLLFTPSASLVLSFNGSPEHRGYNQIEAVQYKEDTRSFEFFEIDFSGASPVLSEPNPQKCLQCHQHSSRMTPDPRPNWEPYNVWPRIYGSLGGRLKPASPQSTDTYDTTERIQTVVNHYPNYLVEQNQELDQLKCFVTQQVHGQPDPHCGPSQPTNTVDKGHPRYRHLDITINGFEGQIDQGLHRFSEKISRLNFRRVSRLTQGTDAYEHFRYLLGALSIGGRMYRGSNGHIKMEKPCNTILDQENLNDLLKIYEDKIGSSTFYSGFFAPLTPERLNPLVDRSNITRFLDLMFFAEANDSYLDWSMDFFSGGRFLPNQRRFRASGNAKKFFSEAFFELEPELSSLSCETLSGLGNEHLRSYLRDRKANQ